MRIGAFQLQEPVPECNEPYAIATLRPWIDVNSVGTMVLNELEERFQSSEIGSLAKPGNFYDYTRYRPTVHIEEGIREMRIPTTPVHLAKRQGRNDLLLLRLLEPHARAEVYVESVMKLLTTFRARKYILLGSMYDTVPHTRPLLVSGYGMGEAARREVRRVGALPITYQGPSTMANLITKRAADAGIETAVFIVSLPQYVALEEDYMGKVRLMEILNILYDIPVDKEDFEKALEQRKLVGEKIDNSAEVKILLPQLEKVYDMRIKAMEAEGANNLTFEMEEIFWKVLGKDIGKA